jgi:GTP-binding protein YchF
MMKLGIIGLPGAGKTTVFAALTRQVPDAAQKGNDLVGTIRVPDPRVNTLTDMYKPKKTGYVQVEYFLPGKQDPSKHQKGESSIWTPIRDCHALIHVIKNFSGYGLGEPTPYNDFLKLHQDLMLADLIVVERRFERIELDHRRGNKMDPVEYDLLKECLNNLENEIPLRKHRDFAGEPRLRGYAFVSAKPMLVLFNNDDDVEHIPDIRGLTSEESCIAIRGKLEEEIAQMAPEEATAFLSEFNIESSAMDRVIQKSFELLDLISFFTIVHNEVRAWPIKKGTMALDAAGAVHSDMKRGFIRAEVVSYDDLMNAGSHQAAKKLGTVRLEGKTYQVQDGDIINFRFNI